MRFTHADPDIATIYSRIEQGEIDLQPDFQRGEVWTKQKQQRLIDTILRGWIVPQILVVDDAHGGILQVLDGQQRLAAIRDFKQNLLSVDGNAEPYSPEVRAMHGKRYFELSVETRRAFDRTTIRMYHVTDFEPEEPAEIFFRLNQPTALTSAEKRNAFFGPVRAQIRDLVPLLADAFSDQNMLGFTNSRMAYDDLLARFACALENGTLTKKVTASSVDLMYRRSEPLSRRVEHRLVSTVSFATEIISHAGKAQPRSAHSRLNKATTLSWLIFFSRQESINERNAFIEYFIYFESMRQGLLQSSYFDLYATESNLSKLLTVYNDRATARVADVSSVLLRDLVLCYGWYEFCKKRNYHQSMNHDRYFDYFHNMLMPASASSTEDVAMEFLQGTSWGSEF
jgi:hypothetical protein